MSPPTYCFFLFGPMIYWQRMPYDIKSAICTSLRKILNKLTSTTKIDKYIDTYMSNCIARVFFDIGLSAAVRTHCGLEALHSLVKLSLTCRFPRNLCLQRQSDWNCTVVQVGPWLELCPSCVKLAGHYLKLMSETFVCCSRWLACLVLLVHVNKNK